MLRIPISSLEQSLAQLKLSSQFLGTSKTSCKSPCVQSARWYRPRKPFWLPIAKSKMFRFPKVPHLPEEERIELFRLNTNYKTSMKSLRAYFKEQLMAQSTGIEVIEERKQRAAEHHANCVRENDLWNAEVAKLREKRLAKEAARREEEIMIKILSHEKQQAEFIEQLDAHVRKEKEAAKSFITPETLDEAIAAALANVVDYNFCIDLKGNVYEGRYGKPAPPPRNVTSTSPRKLSEENPSTMEAVN